MPTNQKRSSSARRRPTAGASQTQFFDTGTGTPMGPNRPLPTNWAPKIVQYYRLGLLFSQPQPPQTLPSLSFRFTPGCGYRLINSDSDFDTFIAQAKLGQPNVTPFKVVERGPHFTIFNQGYVVIQLELYNWRFLSAHPAITIGTNHTPNGAALAYFLLTHIDDQGVPSTGSSPPSSTGRSCRLIHFGVDPRPKSSTDPSMDIDRFNLYFDLDQGFGDVLPLILDPDIKNDGGSDPLRDI